jgi:poly(ADP-ribose) glycohydrolase ARH3
MPWLPAEKYVFLCDSHVVLQLYTTPGGPKLQQQSWQQYFSSPAWMEELSTAAAVALGEAGTGFQIKATDAAAAAIWACVAHWEGRPVDAIIAAVHYGGDTDTIACMAGG